MRPTTGIWKNACFRQSVLAAMLIDAAICTVRAEPPTAASPAGQGPINRHALVTRHNVLLTAADPMASLSVGNGQFAFTVDFTGLQTFPKYYADGIQLGTQSQWGWDSAPNPEKFTIENVLTPYDAHGRQVLYADGQGLLKNRANRAGKEGRNLPPRKPPPPATRPPGIDPHEG